MRGLYLAVLLSVGCASGDAGAGHALAQPDENAASAVDRSSAHRSVDTDAHSVRTQASPERTSRATLASVGDVLPHLMVKAAARARRGRDANGADANNKGYGAVFASLRGFVDRYDIASFNMESPVVSEPLLGHARMRFFADPSMPKALSQVGFDVAVCANNHAFDQGGEGLIETYGQLRAAGLRTAGCGPSLAASSEPVILDVNGIRIAVLSFSRVMNANNPRRRQHPDWAQVLFWYDEAPIGHEVLAAIRAVRARGDVDAIVVNAHWDREYAPTPLDRTREVAAILIAEGVDLVVGHHPHVLEPAEWMTGPNGKRAAVIYSLGNFVSEMCASRNPLDLCDRRLSAVSVATFAKTDGRTELEAVEFEPAWMDHRVACPGEDDPRTGCVRPVIVREELARVERAIAEHGASEALEREREGYRLRLEVIRRFMGPHARGSAPNSPYGGVDPRIVSRSRHGPARPFRD